MPIRFPRIVLWGDLHLKRSLHHRNMQQQQLPVLPHGTDVLVLAGDVADSSQDIEEVDHFLTQYSRQVPQIVYVLGNHEHSDVMHASNKHHQHDLLLASSTKWAQLQRPGVTILNNTFKIIMDVSFVGHTGWFGREHKSAFWMHQVQSSHMQIEQLVKQAADVARKRDSVGTCIVTHYPPPALTRFDLANNKVPTFWLHGHRHTTYQSFCRSTKIIKQCNAWHNNTLFQNNYMVGKADS